MMALLMVGPPLGVVLGYAMTMLIIRAGISWKLSFQIQAYVFGFFVIFLVFLPSIYFSNHLKCVNPTDYILEHEKEKEIKNMNKTLKAEGKIIKNVLKDKNSDVISLYQHWDEKDDKIKNFFKNLCILIKEKVNYINSFNF